MKDKLYQIWSDPRRPTFVLGLLAFNAGIGLGYILGRRTRPVEYNVDEKVVMNFNTDKLNEELAKLRDVSNNKEYVIPNPNLAVDKQKAVKKVVKEVIERLPEPELEDEELVRRSIFVESDDWNYELEIAKRTTEEPYILHRDEFFEDEKDYTQSTFTYYAGDEILVDEDDKPIYNHEQITGQLQFGHGSGDANVVYIRNDRRKAEYEVIFDQGLYSVEVLGLEIEDNQRTKDLRHSKVPKFRED